ncbi:MAG: type II toxin-antitoxin system VapC family toxin [Synechococcus lacustris]
MNFAATGKATDNSELYPVEESSAAAGPQLVDSSGWIEYFTNGPNAGAFASAIEESQGLVVASLSLLEVFQWVGRKHGATPALQAVALMQQATVVSLTTPLALQAAELSLQYQLPLAESIVLATARSHNATVLTLEQSFNSAAGVAVAGVIVIPEA